MLGVTIDGYHTYKDWRLSWLEPYEIEMPEPKVVKVDIPGADGSVDLTDVYGRVTYENRSVTLTFEGKGDYFEFERAKQNIAAFLHGKRCKVYLDTDPEYYYDCRLTASFTKEDSIYYTVTLTGDAMPYKYNEWSAADRWLWDPFAFETDIVMAQKQISVSGSTTIILPATSIPVCPTFNCSSAMTVTVGGTSYNIPSGIYQNPNIIIQSSSYVSMTIAGNGTVEIEYKGGAL